MGAGAIGSLFGGLLALRGEDVLLVGRRSHVDAINSRGLKISGMTDAIVHLRASTHPEEGDLILFTVKSYDTEKAASSLIINDDTIVLSFQNGLGNEEKIAEVVGREHVIGGVTSYGALFLEPGHVSVMVDLLKRPKTDVRLLSPFPDIDQPEPGVQRRVPVAPAEPGL